MQDILIFSVCVYARECVKLNLVDEWIMCTHQLAVGDSRVSKCYIKTTDRFMTVCSSVYETGSPGWSDQKLNRLH